MVAAASWFILIDQLLQELQGACRPVVAGNRLSWIW